MQGNKITFSLLRRPFQRAALATSLPMSSSVNVNSACDTAHHLASFQNATVQRRWQSSASSKAGAVDADGAAENRKPQQTQSTNAAADDSDTAAANTVHVMERAADARREIHDLWSRTAALEEEQQQKAAASSLSTEELSAAEAKMAEERSAAVAALLAKYELDPTTAREADVSRGLGDALDRLLLLCVPLSTTHGTDLVLRLMQVCARQGRQLSMRTIQHLFARTNSYAEALALFYAMRRSNFAMSMEAYHAMLYSLQRLEEEGWAQRFHDEYRASNGQEISEQALDFVLRGVDNQLMPENKPWLGRVMFAEVKDNAAAQKQSRASFDEMGQLWVERYKSGTAAPPE